MREARGMCSCTWSFLSCLMRPDTAVSLVMTPGHAALPIVHVLHACALTCPTMRTQAGGDHETFTQITQAFSILSDPGKRK